MGFRYFWKELTDDGLLKEPDEKGPYYSLESLNMYVGFKTEEDAVAAYNRFTVDYYMGEMVLTKIYIP